MRRNIDPQGFDKIRGMEHAKDTAQSWRKRGEAWAARATVEWPYIDDEATAKAAHCFTIANALEAEGEEG